MPVVLSSGIGQQADSVKESLVESLSTLSTVYIEYSCRLVATTQSVGCVFRSSKYFLDKCFL
jgi:hypothetical protein